MCVIKEAFVVATLRLTLWHKEGVYAGVGGGKLVLNIGGRWKVAGWSLTLAGVGGGKLVLNIVGRWKVAGWSLTLLGGGRWQVGP